MLFIVQNMNKSTDHFQVQMTFRIMLWRSQIWMNWTVVVHNFQGQVEKILRWWPLDKAVTWKDAILSLNPPPPCVLIWDCASPGFVFAPSESWKLPLCVCPLLSEILKYTLLNESHGSSSIFKLYFASQLINRNLPYMYLPMRTDWWWLISFIE